MSNTFGNCFRLTTAGESHGEALVGIIDGMPAGIKIDFELIDKNLSRRKPGQALSTNRNEADKVKFLSGFLDGVSLGTPIAFMIENHDAKSNDYEHLRATFRPNHADFTYQAKYGIRDVRGGGRASARETALRVVAGSLAMQVLSNQGISIEAYTSRVGDVVVPQAEPDLSKISESPIACPFLETSRQMIDELEKARSEGDTLGCEITCIINGLQAGIGEPVYDKISARLAYAMMSINAAHSFEFGDGFALSSSRGSEVIDAFYVDENGRVKTTSNHSGGIQGGISNGMPIVLRVGFKPLPTLMQPVPSINLRGEQITIEPRGRHDVCAAPRVVPVVQAMAAITVLDMILLA